MDINRAIELATTATAESSDLDFKASFDHSIAADWCEAIKDIVAMANAGGGTLVFGVNDDGSPSGWDATHLLALDPAKITDKVSKYTGIQFSAFAIAEASREGNRIAVLSVSATSVPIAFTAPGTYQLDGPKQATAFARGTVYFRHGAKSEPGTTEDLRRVIDGRLSEERKTLMASVQQVFQAPIGRPIAIVPIESGPDSDAPRIPMRLTSDPTAPEYRPVSIDETHPHRQTELVAVINSKLGGRKSINSHDVQCIKRIYGIDSTRSEFCQKPRFGSAQYSEQFADWIVEEYDHDHEFFDKARIANKAQR